MGYMSTLADYYAMQMQPSAKFAYKPGEDVAYRLTGKRTPATSKMLARHKQLQGMKQLLRRLVMGRGGKYPIAPVSDSHYGRIKSHMKARGQLRHKYPTGVKRTRKTKGPLKLKKSKVSLAAPMLTGNLPALPIPKATPLPLKKDLITKKFKARRRR